MVQIAEPGGKRPVPPIGGIPRIGSGGGLPNPYGGAADLSDIARFLSSPLARDEAYRRISGRGLPGKLPLSVDALRILETLIPTPFITQRQQTKDPETGKPFIDPTIPPIFPGAGGVAALGTVGRSAAKVVKAGKQIDEVVPRAMRTVQQQIDALRARGLNQADVAETFGARSVAPPEAASLQTQTAAAFSPAKMTRAIQTALGQAEGGGMPEILADYGTKGPFAPKDLTKHGGVIGAATRAVLAADQDVIAVLGPDLTQQLTQSKIAYLARQAGATEEAIRTAFNIMDNAVGAVTPEIKAAIRQAVRDGTPLAPETEQALFAAQHKALTQAGLPVTDDAVAALTDKLVAEARRVNKAVKGQTATLEQATQEGGSLFKATGEDIVPAVPPAPPGPPAPPTAIAPSGRGPDFGAALSELVNFPRALRATADVSQLFRQGLIPLVSAAVSRDPARRVIARSAFVNAVRGYGDRYAGQVWERTMKDPLFSKWKEAGGFEAVIPSQGLRHLQTGLKAKEELFQSGLAETLPGIGGVVTAAERSYGLTLNALRFETWKAVYNASKSGGKILTTKEQQALAKWLNVSSGRGSLGAFGQAAPVLNAILFAPRFAVSRIEAPILAARLLTDPATREIGKVAAKDLAKTVGAGIALLQMAQLAGFKVGWDPTSTDFGKIRAGDTTIDIWGGFEQPAVFVARIALDQYTSISGRTTSLSQAGYGEPTLLDLLARYGRSKLGPFAGTLLAAYEGKDFTGQPFGPRGGLSTEETVKQLTAGTLVPMSWQDAVEAVIADISKGTSAERGLPSGSLGAVAGVGGLAGVGIGTYGRPIVRDGLGRNVDDDLPPSPVLEAWTALRARAVERAKASGGEPEMPELVAPDKYIGGGERRIELDDAQADRLRVLVGQERERALGQIVSNPAFASLDPKRQETILKSTKAEADRAGQEAFSIELAKSATDDVQRVRAARIGLAAAQGVSDRMDFVARMSAQSALTSEMEGALDDLRDQTDPAKPKYEPSVGEMLTWSANAQRYTSAPPWRVGDPQVWIAVAAQAKRLRGVYNDLRREADAKGVPVQTLPDYKQYAQDYGATKVGTLKIAAFIDLSGDARKAMLSPQRAQIEALPLWDRFRDAVKSRDPYAIR